MTDEDLEAVMRSARARFRDGDSLASLKVIGALVARVRRLRDALNVADCANAECIESDRAKPCRIHEALR